MGLKIISLSEPEVSEEPQRLSLCMMVRDEEESLPRCLSSVKDVVDEMIIVDTGSTDRTVEIAEEFGATVIHEEWTGDFARHRNTGLDAATGDWVLILDADEEIADATALRPLLNEEAIEGYVLREVNFIGSEPGIDAVVNAAFRMFRNRPEYRYEGALHEQIQAKVDPEGGKCTRFVGVEILHYGYLDHTTEARGKKDRNMRIVLEEVKRKPNDAFTLFNAGVEYQRINDHHTALDYFGRAFRNLESMRQYFASLLLRNIVASLKETERYDEALEVCVDGLEAYPDFTDLHYLRGQLHFARREYRESIESFQRAIDLGDHAGDRYMSQAGMGSFYSHFALGTLHEAIGDQAEAVRCYKRSVTTARSLYGPPLVRLTQLLLSTDSVEDVERFIVGIVPEARRAEGLRLIADVFVSEGAHEAARRLLDEALQMAPETHSIRVTLAHCHLAMGEVDLAIETLDAIPASSEVHSLARAKRVLAGLMTARDDLIEQALDGFDAPTYRDAWLLMNDARHGRATSTEFDSPPEAIEAIILDMASALLEMSQLDAFNAVAPLLYQVTTDRPVLDERLGHLLLRNGFVDLGADRLLAAIQSGEPAPSAYALLARVCQDRDLVEDAEVFLRAALEHDSQNMSRYLELASHLSGQGRYAEANEVLSAGLELWPRSTVLRELHSSLGVIAQSR
ncbi:MAG: glycosyltransferase [Thermoleophilia bacterium]